MKQKLLIGAVLTACLALLACGSLAYRTVSGTATNVITAGNVGIALNDLTQDPETGKKTDFPAEGMKGIVPGAQKSKIVSVSNTGKNDAWVRVQVKISIQSPDGETLPVEFWPEDAANGVQAVHLNIDTANWVKYDDYYYCKGSLAPGAVTPALFTQVSFDPLMGNDYRGSTVHVDVGAQAVQTAHNGADVLAASGWPA
jgi:hypothetical protein